MLVFFVVLSSSGVEVCGLDAAAAMAKMEDSFIRWDFPPGELKGNTVGKVGAVLPPHFSVAAFTEGVPPDEAWADRSNWVVGGRGIDSSIVGWLEHVGLVSVFPCWV